MVVSVCPPGGKRIRRRSVLDNLHLVSWNIGSLTGKSIELVKALHRCKISIACIQKTKWVGAKAKGINGYKLWYSGFKRATNGVGILIKKDLAEQVVEVKRKSDHIMYVKLVVSSEIFNVVSVYVPQIGLDEDIKRLY